MLFSRLGVGGRGAGREGRSSQNKRKILEFHVSETCDLCTVFLVCFPHKRRECVYVTLCDKPVSLSDDGEFPSFLPE